MMKFTIAIHAEPQTDASRRALEFSRTVLNSGHQIELLFFYQQGVYNAINNAVIPQDELDIGKEWQAFISQHQLEPVVCIAAALRRGVLDSQEAKRYQKTAINLSSPWVLSGLGQLHEAIQNADRFIRF